MNAPPWTPSDPLGDALHALRLRGAFYCRSHLTAPWALQMPAVEDCLSFHVMTAGTGWLEAPGHRPVELGPGDLALVPHGRGHVMASEAGLRPTGRVDHLPQRYLGEHYSVLTYGGDGASADLVCGVVTFDDPAARSLMTALPTVLHVPANHQPTPIWIDETIRLLASEASEQRPGSEAIITRLADIIVVQAIRVWLEQDTPPHHGRLGALRDERIGVSLTAIHRAPGRAWTVTDLAREAGMSRSAFAARFTELVGEPVMAYVTRWRIHLAHQRLTDGTDTVARIAASLGYRSEAAFTRAYARTTGNTPGATRRTAKPDQCPSRADGTSSPLSS